MAARFNFRHFIYFLMAAYVAYLAFSISEISSLLERNSQRAALLSAESLNLRSQIDDYANIIPGLLSSPDLDFAATEAELGRLAATRDKTIEAIEENFRGDPQTMVGLKHSILDLRRQLRKDAAMLEENPSYPDAVESFNLEIMPYIRQIRGHLDEIDAASSAESAQIQRMIIRRLNLALLISIASGAVIIIFVIMADRRGQAKTRELAHRERLFDQLSRNVDEVFIIAENAGKFAYASPNSQRLLGAEAEGLCANPELLYSLFDHPDAAEWLKGALERNAGGGALEENAGIAGKSFKIRLYPLESGRGESRHIVSLSDQTQAIRQQEALCVALENARSASVAKSGFLSHMSHEIRTPMNAIIGMTTIALARINDQARVQDCLGKIAEASRHLLGLINDVLDMSKIESGKLAISHENFNLRQCVGNISNIVQPQAKARGLEFGIHLDGVEDEELIGDALRLNQVLLNLLSNACKFTPPGGSVTLRIQELRPSKNSARFRFIVADTGIGMSEEFLKRIYEPFEQASAATAARYGGTGLGMPITANLIALMGGSIDVESREGAGTKFTVELPFGVNQQAGAQSRHLPRLKVLVVDDDLGTCEHATLLLNKMGLQTRWTTSGAEAVKLAAEAHAAGNGFDVCLIDWKMPDMDGAETARKIRQAVGDATLIIIISAFDWTPIEEEARKAGVSDFIAKPFFSSSLYDALLSATRRLGQEPAREEAEKSFDFSGRRVLLVEDNEFNREIAQEFLEMANIEVEHAANGQEAVDKALAAPPGYYDLVLMDVQMPVMNGYDATRAIRASGRPGADSLPILAMTANAFSEDVAQSAAAGMNGHIAKPINVRELYKALDARLNRRDAPEKGASETGGE